MCRSPRTAASHRPSGVVADVSKRASSHTATNQAARHVGSSPAWDELRYNGVGGMRTIGLSQPVNTVDDIVAVHTPRSSTQTSATTRRFAKALALPAGGVAVDEQTDDILGAKKSRNRCHHRPRWSLPGWSGGVRCASRRLSKPRSIWVKGSNPGRIRGPVSDPRLQGGINSPVREAPSPGRGGETSPIR
jgi:hypothetical protein